MSNDDNEKFQKKNKLPLKSINGRRCLSKCYLKGATYLHPVLLTGITNITNNGCAIDPIYSKDPQYFKEYDMIFADECRMNDNEKFQLPDELESILLNFYFNPRDFLTSIYDLNSFDQVIYWTLENNFLPFDTIKRVHNCAWKVFGIKLEELSNDVLDYYYDIALNHWLKDFIKIIKKDYSFDFIAKNKITTIEDSFNEIYNLISNKYFTYDFFVGSIKKYVNKNKNNWENIDTHYLSIKKFVFQNLIKLIEKDNKQF